MTEVVIIVRVMAGFEHKCFSCSMDREEAPEDFVLSGVLAIRRYKKGHPDVNSIDSSMRLDEISDRENEEKLKIIAKLEKYANMREEFHDKFMHAECIDKGHRNYIKIMRRLAYEIECEMTHHVIESESKDTDESDSDDIDESVDYLPKNTKKRRRCISHTAWLDEEYMKSFDHLRREERYKKIFHMRYAPIVFFWSGIFDSNVQDRIMRESMSRFEISVEEINGWRLYECAMASGIATVFHSLAHIYMGVMFPRLRRIAHHYDVFEEIRNDIITGECRAIHESYKGISVFLRKIFDHDWEPLIAIAYITCRLSGSIEFFRAHYPKLKRLDQLIDEMMCEIQTTTRLYHHPDVFTSLAIQQEGYNIRKVVYADTPSSFLEFIGKTIKKVYYSDEDVDIVKILRRSIKKTKGIRTWISCKWHEYKNLDREDPKYFNYIDIVYVIAFYTGFRLIDTNDMKRPEFFLRFSKIGDRVVSGI